MGLAPELAPTGALLHAAPGTGSIGSHDDVPGWLINASLPSPLLRIRRGEEFRLTLRNDIPEPLILHWHGLTPPDDMDGHPRFAIYPGEEYEYRFGITERPGTYWYHSHAHMRAGVHTYQGIAGLLIVEDPDENASLPSGDRELPIILQDRRLGPDGLPVYNVMGPSMMTGMMGDEPFANGTHRPWREVESAVYRLRLLNGSNARIFRLGRPDGTPLLLIGSDGGLLPAPEVVPWVDLAPGERIELLLDLRTHEVGDRVYLHSLGFDSGRMMMGGRMAGRGGMGGGRGGMGMMAAADQQGVPLELLEFRVERRTSDGGTIPERLPAHPLGPDPAQAVRSRDFVFRTQMMRHEINGRTYRLDRIDLRVPFDRTELWNFINDSDLPHPVHLHATQFRVVARSGGRNTVLPWESGLKDTVLVMPGERVSAAVRFTAHRGLYLLHCHNLEHEDMGMMQNILVE